MSLNPLQARKERTNRIYGEVLNRAPTLYENVVQIASTTPGLQVDERARLEGRLMGLVLAALNEVQA